LLDDLSLQVKAILLDPSCSGSGTAASRLDHLLPSKAAGYILIFLLLFYIVYLSIWLATSAHRNSV